MFDTGLRRRLDRPLSAVAARIDVPLLTPDRLTMTGLLLGLGSAAAAAGQLWVLALPLWWLSRACDGLDGPLARRRTRHARDLGSATLSGREGSHAGGFLDITADFVVYGATVTGVAVGVWAGSGQSWLPFLFVLLAYYVNGTAFLAFSSIAERTGRRIDDGRSLSFLGGLAEGGETIVVHSVWLLFPGSAATVAAVWAVVVALSATQRIVTGYRALR